MKHSFQVKLQSLEHVDTSADLDGMAKLAAATDGLNFDYRTIGELESLVDQIPTDPQILREVNPEEVWDTSWFLLLFLGLVVPEWCLRKWWGLL